MKTVTLHFDEQVFDDLEAGIRTKRLNGGFGGVIDMVSLAIIETVKNKQVERTLRYRKKTPVINAVGK